MAFKSVGLSHCRIGGQHDDRARHAYESERISRGDAYPVPAAYRTAGVLDPQLRGGVVCRLCLITIARTRTHLARITHLVFRASCFVLGGGCLVLRAGDPKGFLFAVYIGRWALYQGDPVGNFTTPRGEAPFPPIWPGRKRNRYS
jgi:hypothetical protein